MIRLMSISFVLGMGTLLGSGCQTTYEAHRTKSDVLKGEGTIVFVRPDRYSIIGTRSIREYIEITYENNTLNESGYPEVEVGLRHRGGRQLWDLEAPDVQLSIQTAFYREPFDEHGAASGPASYRTNWQVVKLVRGQTFDYRVTCPLKDAPYHQMTISEYLK